jgi:hypothetical protein
MIAAYMFAGQTVPSLPRVSKRSGRRGEVVLAAYHLGTTYRLVHDDYE